MRTTLLKLLLKWLGGITSDQWAAAVNAVSAIARDQIQGNARLDAFVKRMGSWLPAQGFIANLLREVAVAFVRKHTPK